MAAWMVAAAAVAGCAPSPDERTAEQFTQLVQAALAQPHRQLALRELDAVTWQRAEVYGPYTPQTSLPEKLRADQRVAAIGIDMRDDVAVLVLWDEKQAGAASAVLAVPRGTVDLAGIAGQPFYRSDCLTLDTSRPPKPALRTGC